MTSAMPCMIDLILVHIAVSAGTSVLSCSTVGVPPAAFPLALAAPTAIAVGSGTRSCCAPSGGGLLCECLPVALLKATEAMPLTKLSASTSTAFPLWLSEAPVALLWLPNTPDFGFRTPPELLSTRAIGAGGNSIERQGGCAVNGINVIERH